MLCRVSAFFVRIWFSEEIYNFLWIRIISIIFVFELYSFLYIVCCMIFSFSSVCSFHLSLINWKYFPEENHVLQSSRVPRQNVHRPWRPSAGQTEARLAKWAEAGPNIDWDAGPWLERLRVAPKISSLANLLFQLIIYYVLKSADHQRIFDESWYAHIFVKHFCQCFPSFPGTRLEAWGPKVSGLGRLEESGKSGLWIGKKSAHTTLYIFSFIVLFCWCS